MSRWCSCYNQERHTDEIFHVINNIIEENILFAKDETKNNKLALLDVLLTTTDNGTIKKQVYRKKNYTDQVLNFNSNYPTQHEISCTRSLFKHIVTHCKTVIVYEIIIAMPVCMYGLYVISARSALSTVHNYAVV